MPTTVRPYDPDKDYIRIRDFIVDTYAAYGRPYNWLIDRWNFCRYFVIPIHTFYNTSYFGIPTNPGESHRDELPYWQASIRVWENEEGDIVGVTHSENEEPGEAWIQIHPDHTDLYDEMISTIEETLADRVEDLGYVKLFVNDGSDLEELAEERGYRKLPFPLGYMEYRIEDRRPVELPEGFTIKSVADEDDVEKRRIVRALAFGGDYSPSEWPPAWVMREMQKAPDYRADLDLFVVAPSGDYVSFCTIWLDERNGYGNIEPLGTHPEYRGLGLARALMMEAFERMAQRGIELSYMDSGVGFYKKIGFKDTPYLYSPWIKYFEV